jgi:uncharacterized protein (TIGR02246 family)
VSTQVGSSARETELAVLLDKEAIRAVIARAVRGVDRLDADLLGSAFHPDGVDEHHGHPYSGATIGEELTRTEAEIMLMTSLHITTQTIQVNGDRAGVESYYFGVHRPKGMGGDKRLLSSGRMLDELERRDGEWRIIHRDVIPDMARVLSMADEVDLGEQPSRRDRDDPSYQVLST